MSSISPSLPDLVASLLPDGPLALQTPGIRELNSADAASLALPNPQPSHPGAIKRIRPGHHEVARLLAKGAKPGDVSRATGYSPSRVSILQADPLFQELLSYYQSQAEDVFTDGLQALATLGKNATEELIERLDTTPESFGNKQLLEIVNSSFDRAIAPDRAPAAKTAPSIQINFVKRPASVVDITPDSPILETSYEQV